MTVGNLDRVFDGGIVCFDLYVCTDNRKGCGCVCRVCKRNAARYDRPSCKLITLCRFSRGNGDLSAHLCTLNICAAIGNGNCIDSILVSCFDLNIAKNACKRCGSCRRIGNSSLTRYDHPLFKRLPCGGSISYKRNGICNARFANRCIIYACLTAIDGNEIWSCHVGCGNLNSGISHHKRGCRACRVGEHDSTGLNDPARKLIALLGSICSNGNNATRYGTAYVCTAFVNGNCISRSVGCLKLNVAGNHFKGCACRFFIGKSDCRFIEDTPLIEALTCLGGISHYGDSFTLCGSFNNIIPHFCNTACNGDREFVPISRAGVILGDCADHVTAQLGIKFNLGFFIKLGVSPIESHLTHSTKNGSTCGTEHVFANVIARLTANRNIYVARGVDNNCAPKGINAPCETGVGVGFGNIQACISQNHNASVCANAVDTTTFIGFGRADRNGGISLNGNAIA